MPKKDLSEKDTDLLSKVSMVAQAVKVDEKPVFAVDVSFKVTYISCVKVSNFYPLLCRRLMRNTSSRIL